MSKTYTPTHTKVERDWHLIDAEGKVLGRVATDVSKLLIGKHKATYTPNINVGDHVVVINADKIEVTGNKMTDKIYYRHTGFPGGLRSETLAELLAKKPTAALEKAISGMLPKNKLRKQRMVNLHVYAGPEHPHEAQLGKQS